ncbi:MAG: MFS transporter [Alphaproteobacteria bacterium]
MFNELKKKKIRGWCFFDFAISSYPTLIITFFYGAFYANKVAITPEIGTTNWGFSVSIASILSFLLFSVILIQGRLLVSKLKIRFFKVFFYILCLSTSILYFFDQGINELIPLIFLVVSLISFEVINFFYNLSLHKIVEKNKEGLISNLGWAFGYFGGLCSLAIIWLLLQITHDNDYRIFDVSVFLLIGPFVALWTIIFGSQHFKNFSKESFNIPKLNDFFENLKIKSIKCFFFSYFFFNNAVICIFAFASMFAAFLFGLSEKEILILGVFINLSGIIGCIFLGNLEDKIGSEITVLICIIGLLVMTLILFFLHSYLFFWIISLMIGFFIGPIQAASRSVMVKSFKQKNQLSAFCTYSMFGNISAILGPFLVGLIIEIFDDIRSGLLVIPAFFLISLIPFAAKKINV